MSEKPELPNLWVDARFYFPVEVTSERTGDHDVLYIPAERIEKLIAKWHDRHGKADLNYLGHVLNCITDLEALISNENQRT